MQNNLFSDLTLKCGGQDFKVHKLVLYTQSTVFKSMLGSTYAEANQHTIELLEDDPDALSVLLKHLYRFHPDLSGPDGKPMTFAVKVFALADKYAVSSLCTMASNRFEVILDPTKDLDGYIGANKALQGTLYEREGALWEIVLKLTQRHVLFLVTQNDFLASMQEMPALMVDVLKLAGTRASSQVNGDSEHEYFGGGRRLG